MRFFTLDWWQRAQQQGIDVDPAADYARHLAGLKPLPKEVADLERLPSLHDADLQRLEFADGKLRIHLEVLGTEGQLMPLQLHYDPLASLTVTADSEQGLPGPHGFGDLGYNEIDALASGLFEHRLLFSSGVELALRFRGFTFTVGRSMIDQPSVDR